MSKLRTSVLFLLALLVIVADQLTKITIRSYPEGYTIFRAGILRLIHIQNTGAAFGIFQNQSLILTIIAFVGIVVILAYVFLYSHRFPFLDTWLGKLSLGLLLGGTAGNLIDRLSRGYVTDFIYVWIWPAFNVADASIVIGIILFAYMLLFVVKVTKPEPGNESK